MMLKRIIACVVGGLLIASTTLHAQHTDSLPAVRIKESFKVRQLYVPLALLAGGIAFNGNGEESLKMELKEERDEHLQSFHTRLDNYLQFSPIAIAYALDAAGIKSRNDLLNRSAMLVKGELLMLGVTYAGKTLSHQLRPDGSDFSSFPSGHTAQAFAAATFLAEEYKHRFKWMPYASYTLASVVGGLRIANNKHYVSDVLAGAAIGILSMKVSYWTHQYKWGHQHHKQATVLF